MARRDVVRRLRHVEGLTPTEAIALQREARDLVRGGGLRGVPSTIAGVDVSVKDGRASAAIAVLDFGTLEPIEVATATRPASFPYVPGLLAFREVPVVLAAFDALRVTPELLMVDGHGLAHPRRFGIACHVGLALDLPSIGIGKTPFVGVHRTPGGRRGANVRLVDEGDVIGRVLRTRDGVNPVWVSIGHRVDLDTAVRMTLRCCRRYRLPEPIRAAHAAAGRASRL